MNAGTTVSVRPSCEAVTASDTPDTPEVELEPFTRAELQERVRGGEEESDLLEALLVASGRGRGVFDLLVGEGLARLDGERVAELGFSFKDYAREVLDLKRRDARRRGASPADGARAKPEQLISHAHFARELRTRHARLQLLPPSSGSSRSCPTRPSASGSARRWA